MKKWFMILVIIFVGFITGIVAHASFDNIAKGDEYLQAPQLLNAGNLPQQAQAYYLKDIAESLRIIAKRPQ